MLYIYSGRLDISNPNIRKQTPVGIYSTHPFHNRFLSSWKCNRTLKST